MDGPEAPPQESHGKSHSEATFGGRYIETKFDGDMMGQPFSQKPVDMLSYGSYDKASNSYTYHGSMDDPMAPKTKVAVRAVVHIVDPTHYTFEWYETHKGKESKTMQIEYSKQ